MLSSVAHSSLEVHCSYRLKFFVAKNHLRSSSLSSCSLFDSRSCSTRPSQRSKYTEGVALRTRICIAVQRKCVQKKMVLVKYRQNVANKLFISRYFNPVHPCILTTN